MSNNSILLKIENNVAYITLNRPEVFNSFNREMALNLQAVLDDCETDDEVRAIVLTGNGKAFCAGQDLKEVTDPDLNPGFKKILEEHYNPIIERLRKIEKPIVCGVNGVAAGAGANIALAKRLAKHYPDKKIVTIAPDGGEKYLSILEFENV